MRESPVDAKTDRKYYLDLPEDLADDEPVTFILNLHGGGSSGAWQRKYFPACDFVDQYRLVVASPTAPAQAWIPEDDDDHLRNVVNDVFERFGADRIRSFWLAGHSQGGMTSNRLLRTEFYATRVDGWLSLSGGRIGPASRPEGGFGPPPIEGQAPRPGFDPETMRRRMAQFAEPHEAEFSFIYTTGEHEIGSLPETSPWAERFGAGPREQQPDIVDTEAGQVWDQRREGNSSKSWGFKPGPGTAQVWVYPGARDGRVIADVVRLGKGHTEGLEPNVTEELIKLIVSAPGGKHRS
jgi:pimeloyl-ACP methyl ester carboxylesterase